MTFPTRELPPGAFFLFSYPRSGSNWLSSALAYLFGGAKAEARIGPELYPHTYGEIGSKSFWIQAAREWLGHEPLLIKSHESVETVTELYPKGKMLYLLRDGRDALVSYYFFQKAFVNSPEEKTVFACGRQQQDLGAVSGSDVRFDPEEYAAFLQVHAAEWVRHVQSWLQVPDILVVRYEVLHQDFQAELARIVDHLELPLARTINDTYEEYVEHARTLLTGDNRAFHRKGVIGDWKNYRDRRIEESLETMLGNTLTALGYGSGSKG